MIMINQYQRVKTLEEAWTLNKKRSARVLGGMGWMKMSSRLVGTVIDLSDLGLDKIEETEEEFIIGAMVTLRQFELCEGFNKYFANAAKESVKHIVGVQFRNCATMGGSIWLRPGFSDPLTLLMALDTTIELYVGEEQNKMIPLKEFVEMKKDNSILVSIHVKKDGRKVAYQTLRNTETDFPVLAVAVAKTGDSLVAAVGARPAKARSVEAGSVEELIEKAQQMTYGDNIRGSAEYRRMLAGVLIKRAAAKLEV